jgi:hypothetical protein
VLRATFGPKRDDITGGYQKLHNDELHNLCSSPNQVKEDGKDMQHALGEGVHAGFWWERQKERNIYKRTRRRWENNIKMDLREIGRGGVDWVDLAQDRDQWREFVNTVMNLWVP